MAVTIDGSASVTINNGAVLGITSGTAVASTSGTSIDFTSIPSWVKRITVNFGNVSVSGSAVVMVQLGDSGGVETTGYDSNVTTTVGVNAGTYTKTSTTAGIELAYDSGNATLYAGCLTWNLIGSNLWCCSFVLSANNDARMFYGAGTKTLSATLDRVRITTTNGTDTFDAGTVNIMYEG